MALIATLVALAAPTPEPAPDVAPPPRRPKCGHACHERRRAHRRRVHMRRVVRPYRPWLRRVRWCESRGRWTINTGNGFYGAYQFTLRSWRWVGGYGYPHHAPPLEQSYRAVRLLHVQGRGAWPVCG